MRNRRVLPLLSLLAVGCIRSTHGDGPAGSAPPDGVVRVLEDKIGPGVPVQFGDQVLVDFKGTYESGEVWGQGPLTFVVGAGTYPGVVDIRHGSTIRLQYVTSRNDTTSRLVPFPGLDTENEAYMVRRDRGPILVEHTIRSVCRQYKLFLIQTGFGPFEFDLGCWHLPRRIPRPVDPRLAALEREMAEVNSGAESVTGVLDPPIKPRPAADTTRYLGEHGLHLAALEDRPEIVRLLLARGRNPSLADTMGFQPLHYVGWAQRPLQRYVPAFENDYLEVATLLIGQGAAVDAAVGPAHARATGFPENEFKGETALGFAAAECADPLATLLLEKGALPNAHAAIGTTALSEAAWKGCPETVELLLAHGAPVDLDPQGGGTPLQRLIAASAFHEGHFESAELLVKAGAEKNIAAERLKSRLDDPGPGGFGFSNRPVARRILALLR